MTLRKDEDIPVALAPHKRPFPQLNTRAMTSPKREYIPLVLTLALCLYLATL